MTMEKPDQTSRKKYISHPHNIPLEFNQITPFIFVGTNACCKGHFDKMLLKKGIRADISLERESLDHPFGVKFFLWLPTTDHTPPSPEQLRVGVSSLAALQSLRTKTYVHCKRGHGRAPTLVAAFLISQGMPLASAVRFIKTKRPTVHLAKAHLAALRRFDREYNKELAKAASSK